MAGAVLPWAGEFQVKINFVVQMLVNSERQNNGFSCV